MSGALTLVVETSTPHASIALVGPAGVVSQRRFCSDRNHNALLFEPLDELLRSCAADAIGLVLVGSGPGSYSGTRVGIAAAQGVAIALGCPAVSVPSILAVPSADGGTACLAVGDARRGSFWHARVDQLRLTDGPALCDAHGLDAAVAAAVALGIQVFAFEEPSRFPLSAGVGAPIRLEFPDANRLWQAWLSAGDETRRQWATAIPQPLYLKPPHITPPKRSVAGREPNASPGAVRARLV